VSGKREDGGLNDGGSRRERICASASVPAGTAGHHFVRNGGSCLSLPSTPSRENMRGLAPTLGPPAPRPKHRLGPGKDGGNIMPVNMAVFYISAPPTATMRVAAASSAPCSSVQAGCAIIHCRVLFDLPHSFSLAIQVERMPRAMQASGDVFRVRHKESGVVCVFKVFCALATASNRPGDLTNP